MSMGRDEYEEKVARLDAMLEQRPDPDENEVGYRAWIDQRRALMYELRPNIKRLHAAVRQYEPEIVTLLHMMLVVASRDALFGRMGNAVLLTTAYRECRAFYEDAMLEVMDPAVMQRHLEDAGVRELTGLAIRDAIERWRPEMERGWAALTCLFDAAHWTIAGEMAATMLDRAYSLVVGPPIWGTLGLMEARLPVPGDPNYDHNPEIRDAANNVPSDADGAAWHALSELMHGAGFEVSFFLEEDDDDGDDDESPT